LFIITDANGRLLADTSHPKLFGSDLTTEPIFHKALAGGLIGGYWIKEEGIYQVIASPLKFNDQITGSLMIGFSLEKLLIETLPNLTNAKVALVMGKTMLTPSDSRGLFEKIGEEITKGHFEKNVIFNYKIADENYVLVNTPLGEKSSYILARSLDKEMSFFFRLKNIVLFAAIVILIFALILGLSFSKKIIAPINELERGVKRIADGDLDSRVEINSDDEIGGLAESFNDMTEKLKKSNEELYKTAKLKIVGELSAGIVHEVKNPLSLILSNIGYVAKKIPKDDESLTKALKDMERGLNETNTVIEGLLDLASISELEREPVNLNLLIEETLSLVKYQSDQNDVRVTTDYNHDIPEVPVDSKKIKQVFINLLLNAIQAMEAGGEINIKTREREGRIITEITDSGKGIPKEIIDNVFEPFITKGKKRGTGLGLAVVKNIIDLHDGTISVENMKEGGAKFTIFLKAS